MSLKVKVQDGAGTGNTMKVNGEGEASVVVHPHPPREEQVSAIPFRSFFLNGCCASDMRVNGACCNVEFYIEADQCKDVYIKSMDIIIADQNACLNQFGAIAALTNGVSFEWRTDDEGTVVVADQLKSNFDFVRFGAGTPPIGATTSAFRANNVSGASEGYIPFIDFAKLFGLPWGLRLRAGSTDRLVFVIKDNTSTVDAFNVIGYGVKI
jgi:hypothetical protein